MEGSSPVKSCPYSTNWNFRPAPCPDPLQEACTSHRRGILDVCGRKHTELAWRERIREIDASAAKPTTLSAMRIEPRNSPTHGSILLGNMIAAEAENWIFSMRQTDRAKEQALRSGADSALLTS
jgi:hypothetical protein